MATIEQMELKAQHHDLTRDLRALVAKYRAIFDWDVPDIDQAQADGLIVADMREALDHIAQDGRDRPGANQAPT